ncbi:MAG: hypothetical protein ACK5KT_02505 [Dysgonomonas sp.]
MKKLLLFLCVVAVSTLVYSQDADYDLGSYKTGDYKRKSLDLNFGSNGDFGNTTDYGKVQTFQGKLSLEYNQRKNSRKLYEVIKLGINGNLDYGNKDKNIGVYNSVFYNNQDKVNNNDYGVYFSRLGLHYINEKNTFIEFSPNVDFSRQNLSSSELYSYPYDNRYKRKRNDLTTSVSFKLGIGKGRLENVEDARQAIYILEELKEKGILLRSLTTEEINRIATVMTRIKNKRQLDSRIRLIEEIETIDSLLVANGYIDKSNGGARYFTTLYDKWMYGDTPQRLAGSRFTVGLAPHYYFNRYKYHQENFYDGYIDDYIYDGKSINTLREGRVYIDFNYEKPVNLKFQNSIQTSVISSWGRYRLNDSNHLQSEFLASYKWGYYPNTRTYAGVAFMQILRWNRYRSENNYLQSVTGLSANAYYYLSPQLRIFGDCNISYIFDRYMEMNKNNNDKHPRTRFSLGLTYSFF